MHHKEFHLPDIDLFTAKEIKANLNTIESYFYQYRNSLKIKCREEGHEWGEFVCITAIKTKLLPNGEPYYRPSGPPPTREQIDELEIIGHDFQRKCHICEEREYIERDPVSYFHKDKEKYQPIINERLQQLNQKSS